jgi:hypothetical protein
LSESKELTVPERAAVALGAAEHEKALLVLATKYADITKIVNPAGREQCHSAYMELKTTRVGIERAGKDAREDANAFQKAVIKEVERLTAITAAEESRLQALRDAYDAEREAERQAKAAAEKVRVDTIRRRIAEMQSIPAMLVGKPSATIATAIEGLESIEITLETHQEFAGEAKAAQVAALDKLKEMLQAQQAHEAEQARLAEERLQLERERAEAAERDRLAALERQRIEDEQRIERAKAEAAALAERQAEQRKLDEQRAEFEKQQAELAAQQQALREATEKLAREQREREEAEAARIEAEARAKREAAEAAERAEAQRIADEQAAEARRVQAEQDAAEAERIRREYEQFEVNGPGDIAIVEALAKDFDVSEVAVVGWLAKFDAASFLTPTENAA